MPTQVEKNQALAAARRAKAAAGRAADQQSALLGNAQIALSTDMSSVIIGESVMCPK
jgi:hypothetical protein